WIAPNTQLTALELLASSATDSNASLAGKLRQQLLDYDLAIPAAQRRFLMREYQRLIPGDGTFPTFVAEDLAARYLESASPRPGESVLKVSPLPAIWQFGSRQGRLLALHTTTNLLTRMQQAMASPELPRDVRLDLMLPGNEAEEALLSMPAGAMFPGWRVALNLKDKALFEAATRERVKAYIWIGILVVVVVTLLAGLALGLVRRQMALTQLRNDLVANVTHELKTPLSSMRLLVDTLLDSPRIEEQTAREYLGLIARENLRLSRLIDNFLTFSRIERNKYKFNFKPLSATALAESVVAAVGERFNVPGCHFESKIAPNLPDVVADADAMVTALLNLLDNAFKYSGENKQISFAVFVEKGAVRFSVEDNGVGLAPAEAKRVFKRFYQVQQHKIAAGGSGLGLSIVQFIVTAHSGTVHVESELERGSRFVIALPQASTS
ncbi:MAG: GHKL domain-containing protein, partial [Akkermansiaceae bacterium]|nr:GHKL domain-containing protein [Verrucomicrobiales bacterium]